MMATEKQARLARFWRKYLRLTRGRIDALRSLEIIVSEETDDVLKATLSKVLTSIQSGTALSDAFRQQPEMFSLCVVELLAAAENSGAWDDILKEIADGLDEGTFA
jgi:type II secretory pathway component PulF|tara:strand:- start:268 stop:585 length:318 start_codon:yes stop_codon:yes gene_type:complete